MNGSSVSQSGKIAMDVPVVGGEDSEELVEGVINLSDKALRQLYWLVLDGPATTQALAQYHQATGSKEDQDSKARRWGRADLGEIVRHEFKRRAAEVNQQPIQRSSAS
jgi:hypothetical protein